MVLIDMDIPENCYDCYMQTEPCGNCGAAEMVDETYGIVNVNRSTVPYCNKEGSGKPKWCPLQEASIELHGEMIGEVLKRWSQTEDGR